MHIVSNAQSLIVGLFRPVFLSMTAICFGLPAYAGNPSSPLADPVVIGPPVTVDSTSYFYAGLSLGYAWGFSDEFGLRTTGAPVNIGDLKASGSFGGLRGGWRTSVPASGNRDYSYGVELSYDFASIEDSVSRQFGSANVGGRSEITDLFGFRFRSGLTNRKRSTLYFASIGYVNGNVKTAAGTTDGLSSNVTEKSDRRNGLLLSIGAEHQLTDNWSLTGEYEYVQFESKVIDFNSSLSTKSTPTYGGLRFGLNYRF
ncbi:MAG: outer membrane protein [Ruegeria sp.]